MAGELAGGRQFFLQPANLGFGGLRLLLQGGELVTGLTHGLAYGVGVAQHRGQRTAQLLDVLGTAHTGCMVIELGVEYVRHLADLLHFTPGIGQLIFHQRSRGGELVLDGRLHLRRTLQPLLGADNLARIDRGVDQFAHGGHLPADPLVFGQRIEVIDHGMQELVHGFSHLSLIGKEGHQAAPGLLLSLQTLNERQRVIRLMDRHDECVSFRPQGGGRISRQAARGLLQVGGYRRGKGGTQQLLEPRFLRVIARRCGKGGTFFENIHLEVEKVITRHTDRGREAILRDC